MPTARCTQLRGDYGWVGLTVSTAEAEGRPRSVIEQLDIIRGSSQAKQGPSAGATGGETFHNEDNFGSPLPSASHTRDTAIDRRSPVGGRLRPRRLSPGAPVAPASPSRRGPRAERSLPTRSRWNRRRSTAGIPGRRREPRPPRRPESTGGRRTGGQSSVVPSTVVEVPATRVTRALFRERPPRSGIPPEGLKGPCGRFDSAPPDRTVYRMR